MVDGSIVQELIDPTKLCSLWTARAPRELTRDVIPPVMAKGRCRNFKTTATSVILSHEGLADRRGGRIHGDRHVPKVVTDEDTVEPCDAMGLLLGGTEKWVWCVDTTDKEKRDRFLEWMKNEVWPRSQSLFPKKEEPAGAHLQAWIAGNEAALSMDSTVTGFPHPTVEAWFRLGAYGLDGKLEVIPPGHGYVIPRGVVHWFLNVRPASASIALDCWTRLVGADPLEGAAVVDRIKWGRIERTEEEEKRETEKAEGKGQEEGGAEQAVGSAEDPPPQAPEQAPAGEPAEQGCSVLEALGMPEGEETSDVEEEKHQAAGGGEKESTPKRTRKKIPKRSSATSSRPPSKPRPTVVQRPTTGPTPAAAVAVAPTRAATQKGAPQPTRAAVWESAIRGRIFRGSMRGPRTTRGPRGVDGGSGARGHGGGEGPGRL